MGEDPRDIQERIEETREQMGDTVDALAHKADVPGRIKGSVADKVSSAKDRITGGAASAQDSTGELAGQAKSTARKSVGLAQENPLGLAIGSLAAGFVVGMLIPSTTIEDEQIGAMADQVKEQAREIGGEAIEHGKQVAQVAGQAAADTAKQAGQEHAHELQQSMRESARETAEEVRS